MRWEYYLHLHLLFPLTCQNVIYEKRLLVSHDYYCRIRMIKISVVWWYSSIFYQMGAGRTDCGCILWASDISLDWYHWCSVDGYCTSDVLCFLGLVWRLKGASCPGPAQTMPVYEVSSQDAFYCSPVKIKKKWHRSESFTYKRFLCFSFLLLLLPMWRFVDTMRFAWMLISRNLYWFTCSTSAPLMQTGVCLYFLFSKINNQLLGSEVQSSTFFSMHHYARFFISSLSYQHL